MDILSQTIITAINKVKNAVVKIDLTKIKRGKKVISGTGSGFIFSSDGYLFTNNHVVEQGDSYTVGLLDGSEFAGELIGKDADTDLAILKIYGTGYSSAAIGPTEDLQVGQLVVAIGNPLGYHHSVSAGVLSSVGRTMKTANGRLIDNILQSDTSLNPGSSGGPLINTEGEVIGINTAIIRGAQGISFSINIETAKEIANDLINNGKVTKAYLGLMLQEIKLHPRIKNFHKLNADKGLLVIDLVQPSPASRANIRQGDILIEFDGNTLETTNDLFKKLTQEKIFNPTTLKFLRKTELKQISIFPVEKPAA